MKENSRLSMGIAILLTLCIVGMAVYAFLDRRWDFDADTQSGLFGGDDDEALFNELAQEEQQSIDYVQVSTIGMRRFDALMEAFLDAHNEYIGYQPTDERFDASTGNIECYLYSVSAQLIRFDGEKEAYRLCMIYRWDSEVGYELYKEGEDLTLTDLVRAAAEQNG